VAEIVIVSFLSCSIYIGAMALASPDSLRDLIRASALAVSKRRGPAESAPAPVGNAAVSV
jgi:hypothetical protein